MIRISDTFYYKDYHDACFLNDMEILKEINSPNVLRLFSNNQQMHQHIDRFIDEF